jgi:ComF family protein
MQNVLEHVSRLAVDLLFPPQCALCGAGGVRLCVACIDALMPADGRRCDSCWTPLARGDVCRQCTERPPAFASIRSAYVMDGGARRLAHELKYEGITSLAAPMALLMSECAAVDGADLIVPVPLHRSRERARGYNQASELGKHLAAPCAVAFDRRALRRTRATAPLAKTMHREERRAIVAGAFRADTARVEGRSIMLVDDVVTTGATLDVCAEALIDAGAASVRCVTWTRAD